VSALGPPKRSGAGHASGYPWHHQGPAAGWRDCHPSSPARMLTTKPRTGPCFYTKFRTRPRRLRLLHHSDTL